MNIPQKVTLLKVAINSVVDHDDAPLKEVEDAVAEVHAYLDYRVEKAKERRAMKEQEVRGA